MSRPPTGKRARRNSEEEEWLESEVARLRARIRELESLSARLAAGETEDTVAAELAAGEKKAKGGEADEKRADDDDEVELYEAPEYCIPIRADVTTFDFELLAKSAQFDVIVMDPPWQLATSAPTRGVAIGYQQLGDRAICELPIGSLSSSGLIFLWVINAKYALGVQLLQDWGYTFVDDVAWVKRTVNRRLAKGHGFYLQHAKESCLVGRKGDAASIPGLRGGVGCDVIYSDRRGQSQKPEELYRLIEQLVPDGRYLEIFARKNNLRDYWTSIGNEL